VVLWSKGHVGRLIKRRTLANGLTLEVRDESAQYYADFWNLKVVIRGQVRVQPAHLHTLCPSSPSEQEAKEALGAEVTYHRELTRIGVREADKEETIHRLVGSFEENTLPYLRYPTFPEKLVRHQWQQMAEELTEKGGDRG
jgi:hypothetical protein